MLEFLVVIAFFWLGLKVIGLGFRVAWGAAKIIASILLVLAAPVLIGCLILGSGILLLLPLALIGLAFGLLKACV